MKRKMIVLAVAAALSGTVSAQSNVSIYGRVDIGVLSQTNDAIGMKLDQVSPNRWGLIGEENLGDGMKAFFRLENRFLLDTGAERSGRAGMQWTDKAWVGLSSKEWGSITVGRILPVGNTILGGGDFEAMTDSIGSVNSRKGRVESNLNNGIKYDTPQFKIGDATLTFDNHLVMTETTEGGKVPWGTGFQYRNGALKVDAGYQHDVFKDGSDPKALDRLVNSYFGGAAWDFGSWQLKGTFARSYGYDAINVKNEQYRMQSWQVSLNSTAYGPGILGLMYNYKTERDAKGVSLSPVRKIAAGYWYKFSKRTMVMPTIAWERARDAYVDGDSGVKSADYQLSYQLGLRHEF